MLSIDSRLRQSLYTGLIKCFVASTFLFITTHAFAKDCEWQGIISVTQTLNHTEPLRQVAASLDGGTTTENGRINEEIQLTINYGSGENQSDCILSSTFSRTERIEQHYHRDDPVACTVSNHIVEGRSVGDTYVINTYEANNTTIVGIDFNGPDFHFLGPNYNNVASGYWDAGFRGVVFGDGTRVTRTHTTLGCVDGVRDDNSPLLTFSHMKYLLPDFHFLLGTGGDTTELTGTVDLVEGDVLESHQQDSSFIWDTSSPGLLSGDLLAPGSKIRRTYTVAWNFHRKLRYICGPDVTDSVNETLDEIKNYFDSLSGEDKVDHCQALHGENAGLAWDIYGLYYGSAHRLDFIYKATYMLYSW